MMSEQNYYKCVAVATPGVGFSTLSYSQRLLSRIPSTTRNWRIFLNEVKSSRLKRTQKQKVPWGEPETETFVQFMERFGLIEDEHSENIQNGNCSI